ncbi:GNAT family N-acetyltransferase [Pseudogemmobacter bohemicus]|uniref:GNAT family N-acetyltransferase n=1 Tax=Pseudogemmobacter bohemicus TaxID=2250708 RepID=UPI000DD3738B|nr:GNAT family N-acetyltransferase [Pseudogemmobacter bohemicus]
MYETSFVPGILRSFLGEEGNDLAESREILAAFDEDRFPGYIWFRASSHRGARAEIVICDIAVMPEFRGQGIGRVLVQSVVDLAGAKDTTNLTADVWAGNIALARLFAGLGFEVQSETFRLGPDWPLPPLVSDGRSAGMQDGFPGHLLPEWWAAAPPPGDIAFIVTFILLAALFVLTR